MTATEGGWQALGAELAAHRMRKHMSKRSAAMTAGFSEATWRMLEEGVRRPAKGVEVEMSARPETVANAARAVGMDPAVALRMVGIEIDFGNYPAEPPEIVGDVNQRLDRVEATLDRMLDLLEQLSERVLGPDGDALPSEGESRTAR